MDLVVGRIGMDFVQDELFAHLRSQGVPGTLIASINSAQEIEAIDLMNGASLFLEHVIELEGYEDIDLGLRQLANGMLRLRNLPVWEAGAWLPFDVREPSQLVDDPTFFVGSCTALLRELAEIEAKSPFPISTPPEAYQLMRQDNVVFARKWGELQLSDAEIVRWVWCGLHDGAQAAIRENSVLCATPD